MSAIIFVLIFLAFIAAIIWFFNKDKTENSTSNSLPKTQAASVRPSPQPMTHSTKPAPPSTSSHSVDNSYFGDLGMITDAMMLKAMAEDYDSENSDSEPSLDSGDGGDSVDAHESSRDDYSGSGGSFDGGGASVSWQSDAPRNDTYDSGYSYDSDSSYDGGFD